jgi:hypothetical protein
MTISSAEEFIRLRFSKDPDDYRRAANEPASIQVWEDVIDRYPDARFWVAHNKTVPLEILTILASDPDPRVRAMVVKKRKLTAELLAILAGDTDETVRMGVARHARTPRSVLEGLATDSWEEIRSVVAERLHDLDK